MHSLPYPWLLTACLFVAIGCDGAQPEGHARQAAPLDGAADVILLHATTERDGVERLVARLEPAMPNTDAPRVARLANDLSQFRLPEGTKVLDARLVEGGVVVLTAENVLQLHTRHDVRRIDDLVHPPLAVASGHVAYMKGGIPDMTLHRASLDGGAPEPLAPEIYGWSPALSADGSEAIFVANVNGLPQLLHVDSSGAIYEIDWSGRFPTAPVAPRWIGDTLTFGDEDGVVVLDLKRGNVLVEYAGAQLLPDDSSARPKVLIGGQTVEIDAAEVAR